ncbi:MAG TPA: hypothetical protein PKA41_14365, partial [Verrucomicrobiota bacterium]|nr:hypothetical protein [Verrucomicrobiota bacterium]
RLINNASLNITNGWLKIATRFENGTGCTSVVRNGGSLVASNLVNNGTLRLTGPAGLSVSGTFTNNGTLDLISWTGSLPPGFVNNGTILDRSELELISPALAGTNFNVTIYGHEGHAYRLQYRDSLSSGDWQNAGSSIAGSNANIEFTHTGGGSETQRHYRVAVD